MLGMIIAAIRDFFSPGMTDIRWFVFILGAACLIPGLTQWYVPGIFIGLIILVLLLLWSLYKRKN